MKASFVVAFALLAVESKTTTHHMSSNPYTSNLKVSTIPLSRTTKTVCGRGGAAIHQLNHKVTNQNHVAADDENALNSFRGGGLSKAKSPTPIGSAVPPSIRWPIFVNFM
jgi:hypothetical protein